jgi:hemoglobin/transferrin/lactoferrin receptor protein
VPPAIPAPPAPVEPIMRAAEVIEIRDPWPGVDLVDAERTSRSTSVVTPSKVRAAATFGDHLLGTAGVSIQRTGPGQAVPIVRGLIGSAVLILVDGIRLNNAIFRPSPNQYTSLVDPWKVDRVTVIKGPGSVFGSDALGGVIEVTTELPSFVGPRWQAYHQVSLGAASADRSTVGHAAFFAGRHGLSLTGSVTAENHEDLRSGNGVRQTPSDYRTYGAQLAGQLDRSGRSSTTAWLQYYEQPELPRTDELRPGYGQDEPAAEVWVYRPSRRIFAHLRELIRKVGPLDGLELHAAYQRIDDDRRIRDTDATEELREEISDHSVTGTVRTSASLLGFVLVNGLEVLHDLVDCARQTLDTTTGILEDATCRFPDGSTMTQLALFAEARYELLGGRLGLRAGARASVALLSIADLDRSDEVDASADLTTSDGSFELGLEFHATEELSLLANLGRGFRAPNIGDLSGLGPRPGNRYQQPAESLANERALGVDLGVRLRHARLTGEAFLFSLRHDDRIDVIPTGEMTDGGRQIVVSDNVGTTSTYGVEMAASLQVRDDLQLSGALTWIRGTKDDRGEGEEPADRMPPLGGSLAARWLPIPALELEASSRFAAAQRRLSARTRKTLASTPPAPTGSSSSPSVPATPGRACASRRASRTWPTARSASTLPESMRPESTHDSW